jgi:hypothetical protein
VLERGPAKRQPLRQTLSLPDAFDLDGVNYWWWCVDRGRVFCGNIMLTVGHGLIQTG